MKIKIIIIINGGSSFSLKKKIGYEFDKCSIIDWKKKWEKKKK